MSESIFLRRGYSLNMNSEVIYLNFQVSGCNNNCFHCHAKAGRTNEHKLMNIDEVIKVANKFRNQFQQDIKVLLMEEPTLYPDFFELITVLEEHGFKDYPTLVSNGWGLANREDFDERLIKHYENFKPTLYGLEETHNRLAKNKDAFNEIINATEKALSIGLKVSWQIILSKQNSEEIDEIYELGKKIGVDNIFSTSGAFAYTGDFLKNAKNYVAHKEDLENINNKEVIYHDLEEIKTESDFVKEIKDGKEIKVNPFDLNHLYITNKLDVYIIYQIFSEASLGNLEQNSIKEIVKNIQNNRLPEILEKKQKLNFNELALKYGDINSTEIHSPNSLFEKLWWENYFEK